MRRTLSTLLFSTGYALLCSTPTIAQVVRDAMKANAELLGLKGSA